MESDQWQSGHPHTDSAITLRLKALLESDPGAVIRVLHHFQVRNIVPRRVSAQSIGTEYIQIEIEIGGLSYEVFHQIAAKLRAVPAVLAAVVCDQQQS